MAAPTLIDMAGRSVMAKKWIKKEKSKGDDKSKSGDRPAFARSKLSKLYDADKGEARKGKKD